MPPIGLSPALKAKLNAAKFTPQLKGERNAELRKALALAKQIAKIVRPVFDRADEDYDNSRDNRKLPPQTKKSLRNASTNTEMVHDCASDLVNAINAAIKG